MTGAKAAIGCSSKQVRLHLGERWNAIKDALLQGNRGLPGGTTLARLIKQHRPGARGKIRKRPNR